MNKIVAYVGKRGYELLTKISKRLSANTLYLMRTHKLPNLKNPKTFNEKTTWLKLNQYNDDELISKCTDKCEVREYVRSVGGKELLTKVYQICDKPEEIDYSKLPNKFAIKCNHGCAYNIICKDKNNLNKELVNKKVKAWMREKYGLATTELHYLKIKPKVYIEEYLCDEDDKMPNDYKFYCFDGKPQVILTCSDRDSGRVKLNYYDLEWNELSYCKEKWRNPNGVEKPENLKEMIDVAAKLSQGFKFVRVDLYDRNGKILFGELTFTPACCCAPYYSRLGDIELGKLLNINNDKPKIGIIGHFGGNKKFFDGQTIKTKEINNYFESKFNEPTLKFDTYKNSKNVFKLLFGIHRIVKKSDVIIIILSSRGYKIVLPIVYFLNRNKKKILDFVIGGNRQNIMRDKKHLQSIAKKVNRIYVETNDMKNEYNKLGFRNVEVIPNFKNLIHTDIKKFEKKDILKLCTFSRVCKEKGIEDAISAVNKCNEILGNNGEIILDIYGQVDSNYVDEFEKLKQIFNKNISYKGTVDYDKSVNVLKEYDMLMFLTFWEGEGFPGTIIDAFFSGVPTLATDWNFNFEILRDEVTGIKVEVHDIKAVVEKILYYFNNQEKLYEMKKNCIEESKKYSPDNIMKNVVLYIQEK